LYCHFEEVFNSSVTPVPKNTKGTTLYHTLWTTYPFRTVQDNKELSGKYWHDIVERLIKTHGNTEIKRCSYTIRMYGGGPLHEPFFIGKGADRGYIIRATKKAIAIQTLGEENVLD